tara:strand:- start:383 stop:1750 length:1368 start_codon:yes stop_codon:yes gene_type:complete
MQPHIFRQYDIRGIVGDDLDAGITESVGQAFASYVRAETAAASPTIAVGGDNRKSSPDLTTGLIAGIRKAGVNVLHVGTVPTPVLYWTEAMHDVQAGVEITGSHNPPEWNGIKMNVKGGALYGDAIQNLLARIIEGDLDSGAGSYRELEVIDAYIKNVSQRFDLARPMRVAVDCGNGTASLVAEQLMQALGVTATPLFCESDPTFPNHHPDPTVDENLQDLIATVEASAHDLGVAFDGDGDRLGVVDETGSIIRGDLLVLLYGLDLLSRKGPGQSLVFDIKCSQVVAEVFAKAGGHPIMWKTGHSLIKKKMRETGALLGGELSGHIMIADDYFGFDDALYSACRLISMVSASGISLSEMVADFPTYASTPEIRIDVAEEQKWQVVEEAVAHFGKMHEVITVDGARIQFADGWALLRASNTQPTIVARFEARTNERLSEIQAEIDLWLQTRGLSVS